MFNWGSKSKEGGNSLPSGLTDSIITMKGMLERLDEKIDHLVKGQDKTNARIDKTDKALDDLKSSQSELNELNNQRYVKMEARVRIMWAVGIFVIGSIAAGGLTLLGKIVLNAYHNMPPP